VRGGFTVHVNRLPVFPGKMNSRVPIVKTRKLATTRRYRMPEVVSFMIKNFCMTRLGVRAGGMVLIRGSSDNGLDDST